MRFSVIALSFILSLALTHAEESFRVVFLPPEASPGITRQMEQGLEAALQELKEEGVSIEIIRPGKNTRSIRLAQADTLREIRGQNLNAHAILIAPMDCMAVIPAMEEYGLTPIVCLDSVPLFSPFVTSCHHEAGQEAARRIASKLKGKGRVVLFRHAIHDQASESREEGFMEIMRTEFPQIEIVSSDFHAGDTLRNAERAANSLLRRVGPTPDAVFASNEAGTLGMLSALEGKNVIIVGSSEGSPIIQKAIQSDKLDAAIVTDYYGIAKIALKALFAPPKNKPGEITALADTRLIGKDGSRLIRPTINIHEERIYANFFLQETNENYQKPAPLSEKGKSLIISDIRMELLKIMPGSFNRVLTDKDGKAITVKVEITHPFWMGRFEVTQEEWSHVMGDNPSMFNDPRRPVENVSWTDINQFCQKLTEREKTAGRLPEGYVYRLPTEAEWEYCRNAGGSYPPEDFKLDEHGHYSMNSGHYLNKEKTIWRMSTHPVGTKNPNVWGFYDMFGNVQEFMADISDALPTVDTINPTGAKSGNYRVLRGGNWWTDAHAADANSRQRTNVTRKHSGIGFRIVLGKPVENL